MINVQAVADYLASSSNGGAEDRALISSLLSIANTLASQQGASTAPAAALQPLMVPHLAMHRPQGASGPVAAALVETPPEMETLAEGIKMFVQRYPIDTRAYEYLVTSSATVVAHVLRDFRPPHEGEPDYSRLLTTYVKRIRSHYAGVAEVQNANSSSAVAGAESAGSSRWRPLGAASALGAGSAFGGLAAAGTAGLQLTAAITDASTEVDLVEAIQIFVQKYPADDRAYNLLVNASPSVQLRVLREFRPHRLGDSDYSALLTTFTKRCMEQEAQGTSTAQQASGVRSSLYSPVQQIGTVPHDLGTALTTPGLDVFLSKYPIDERAYNFFASSSTEVQEKVLREFQPMHEGEASYSKLFTAFVNKCRTFVANNNGIVDAAACTSGVDCMQSLPVDGSTTLGAIVDNSSAELLVDQYGSSVAQVNSGSMTVLGDQQVNESALDLEEFRLRFPMDERAFDFLATAPREVQERVLETFVPQRLDDTDFSAPVTAYVRSLRNQLADANVSAGVTEEAIARFFERYPCDARATDYFQSCTPDVQVTVLRDFRPRSEGDSDYSAAVTAYVKRCKQHSREVSGGWGGHHQQGNWRPPLRPPLGGWGPP
eukprot:CAMPEP_0172676216 /NCGR_PEP_ID=MMETSP1074-20121228/13808_1 /TAXON_ID=2916 /ORGANISM="Ceratium fusus, Strain PA161109" /LENGTH=600 /DNA_ID=CAMNT_0013493823 /DNA_START=150 /DNA_END=1948 /DNA_ORIENTATION=-